MTVYAGTAKVLGVLVVRRIRRKEWLYEVELLDDQEEVSNFRSAQPPFGLG